MRLRHCLRTRVYVPTFALLLFVFGFLLLSVATKVFADDWEGCSCPTTSSDPQTWVFTGDANCNEVHFVWCANCEPDIAGYELEYKIVSTEPTGIIGPDDYRNPWGGTGIAEGDSPIQIWEPGDRSPEATGVDLTDKNRPEIKIHGLEGGKYYVFALRAIDLQGHKSGHSDENSCFTVCGPAAPKDLIWF